MTSDSDSGSSSGSHGSTLPPDVPPPNDANSLPPSSVLLYLRPPVADEPILFLCIPVDQCALYSTRLLKWLRYCGYVLSGVQSRLYLWSDTGDQTVDLESPSVEAGQRYIYSLDEPPVFFDPLLRRPASVSTKTALSVQSALRLGLIDIYQGCPFTGGSEDACLASHLIPKAKGNQALYAIRGHGAAPMDIDDNRNTLLLRSTIHVGFVNLQSAFIKTPNFALKMTEVPAVNRPDRYEGYCVTVHCFSPKPRTRRDEGHGAASHLKAGSGLDNSSFARGHLVHKHRPPDFILDWVYACTLFASFKADPDVPEPIKTPNEMLYPGGVPKRGEDREGAREQETMHYRERDDRHIALDAKKTDEQMDAYDVMMAWNLRIRGTSMADLARRKEKATVAELEKKRNVVQEWRSQVTV